jgi:hypothetical protein
MKKVLKVLVIAWSLAWLYALIEYLTCPLCRLESNHSPRQMMGKHPASQSKRQTRMDRTDPEWEAYAARWKDQFDDPS